MSFHFQPEFSSPQPRRIGASFLAIFLVFMSVLVKKVFGSKASASLRRLITREADRMATRQTHVSSFFLSVCDFLRANLICFVEVVVLVKFSSDFLFSQR